MVANEEPLLGSRSSSAYRPPSVVTSTEFDDDDVFQSVARALLLRHDMEGMCEREAINATLVTSEDKRGFLESLDLRSSTMYANIGDDELENSGINEILEMTRSTFGATLKLLWRESITGYDSQSSGILSEEDLDFADDNEYRHRLNTPKNLHSPIRAVLTETCRSDSNCSIQPKSSGRQRRRFFSDISEQPRSRSRIRLDFELSHGGEQVKSLEFDGYSLPSKIGYAPPSPIATATMRVCIARV
jgi:hypothetical protein